MPNKSKSKWNSTDLKRQYRVRKRGTLKKDFFLGLKGINILYINLRQLISKKNYTIPYTLFYNGYQVLTFALANFRTNTFTLIDT